MKKPATRINTKPAKILFQDSNLRGLSPIWSINLEGFVKIFLRSLCKINKAFTQTEIDS